MFSDNFDKIFRLAIFQYFSEHRWELVLHFSEPFLIFWKYFNWTPTLKCLIVEKVCYGSEVQKKFYSENLESLIIGRIGELKKVRVSNIMNGYGSVWVLTLNLWNFYYSSLYHTTVVFLHLLRT